MKAFRYSGPMQTIQVRLAGTLPVDAPSGAVPSAELKAMTFVPGRRCELPEDHRLVATFTAQGFLEPWNGEAAGAAGHAPLTELEAAIADEPKGSPARIAAIRETFVALLKPTDFTGDGQPRVSSVSTLTGFDVTAAEIRTATETNPDGSDAFGAQDQEFPS